MSQCRSFGSNYHPSSQSRKISIGILVDQSPKIRPNDVRAEAAAVPITGNLGPCKVNSTEDTHKKDKTKDPSNDKQTKAAEHETPPWVSTRSFHQNVPSFDEFCNAKQASSAMLNQRQRSNGANDSEQHSVQFMSNQMSVLQSDDGLQKKFNRVTYRRRGQKDENSDRVNEVPFVTAQDSTVPAKEGTQQRTENTENKGNETLRMKLWEVLGNVSTPTKQSSSSQAIQTVTDNLEPEGKSDKKESPAVKPRQNSDTIESDSDSPNHTMKRPVTRSLTRKRLPKAQQHKTKKAPPSGDKHKHQEKTIFSFDEGWSRRITSATKGGPSVLKREKKENPRIEPRKLRFPKCNNEDETQQVTDNGKKKSHFESSFLFESGMGRSCSFPLKDKDTHSFTVMEKTDRSGNHKEPIIPKTVDEQDAENPPLKTILKPQFQFQTPTLGVKLPTRTCFPGSSPKKNQAKKDVHSPMRGVLNMENIRSFKSFLASELDSDKKNKETDTSDDVGEGQDYPVKSSLPHLKENHMAKSPSTSSFEENDSENSVEGSPTEGPSAAETPSPEIITAQEPEILLRPTKRCRINKHADATVFSPLSTSPIVSGEFPGFPSELNQENGLARAVSLFAMVLERVKSKMKTVTNKRSAKILTSVAADIHLQLQNAESQIQKEVGKLTGIGKTKRKRLETRFQEQQEQLKDMYGRFRNEVNLHLQDCRSTLEGLESQQTEFKEIVEEQKAAHGKILLQAEEAIKTQLNDAERRITTVHKLAREKMLQLKYVIAECLEEDVLC